MVMYEIEEIDVWKQNEDKTVMKFDAEGSKWIYLFLNKGKLAGEHYHKGIVEVKNPEVNVILKGKAEYTLEDVKTGKVEKVEVEAPKIIKIPPYVQHTIKAIEDLMFIEPFDQRAVEEDRFEIER